MRPTILLAAIKAVITTGVNSWVWGAPGVGKSDIIRQAAAELGLQFIDVRAVLLDPVDLRGLPVIGKNGKAKWAAPDFLPTEGRGILFLDELAQAPTMVQNALLQLTLDRKLGEYVLPDGWVIVAASNRVEDRAGANRVTTTLNSRFAHFDIEVSGDDWQAWALGNNIRPDVRSFIASRPTLLHKFDASSGDRSFPCPRTWAFVSRILAAATDDTMYDLVSGCVGAGPAAEFVAFAKLYKSLPDFDAVLANPAAAAIPTEPDVLYATCGAIVEKVRTDPKKSAKAAQYAARLPKEFGVLLFRDLVRVDKAILATADGRKFLTDNRDSLI